MKIISFNINGLRAHFHQLTYIIQSFKPDIIGLQETKVGNAIFPIKEIFDLGYYSYFNGDKSYSGVALLSKIKPKKTKYIINIEYDEIFKNRIIVAEFCTSIGILNIINGYFPQGNNKYCDKFNNKRLFFKYLHKYVSEKYDNKSLLLIIGDINISSTNLDVGLKYNTYNLWIKKGICSFLPEERQWINKFFDLGLVDVYRYLNFQDNKKYSWFDYRNNCFKKNIGLRIDVILASKKLLIYLKESNIDYYTRSMYRPSDHAPVWAIFNANIKNYKNLS